MIHLQDLNSSARAACVIVSILMYIQMTETILKLIESCGLHLKFDTALKYVIAIHIHIYVWTVFDFFKCDNFMFRKSTLIHLINVYKCIFYLLTSKKTHYERS